MKLVNKVCNFYYLVFDAWNKYNLKKANIYIKHYTVYTCTLVFRSTKEESNSNRFHVWYSAKGTYLKKHFNINSWNMIEISEGSECKCTFVIPQDEEVFLCSIKL